LSKRSVGGERAASSRFRERASAVDRVGERHRGCGSVCLSARAAPAAGQNDLAKAVNGLGGCGHPVDCPVDGS